MPRWTIDRGTCFWFYGLPRARHLPTSTGDSRCWQRVWSSINHAGCDLVYRCIVRPRTPSPSSQPNESAIDLVAGSNASIQTFRQAYCSEGAIAYYRKSAKNPYFKSQLYVEEPGHRKPVLYVEDPGHRKPVLILPNRLINSIELADDRK